MSTKMQLLNGVARARRQSTTLLTLGAPELSPWQKDDAAWFASNCRRSFRLRRIHPGELHGFDDSPFDAPATHALIKQIAPGLREKIFCNDLGGGQALDGAPDNDNILTAFWLLVDASERMGSGDALADIHPHEVVQLARKLDAHGTERAQ